MPALRDALQAEGALVEARLWWSAVHVRRLRQAQQPIPPALDCRALIDTGAEITCADTALIQQLGLPLAQITLANVPAFGGLRAGAHYHGGLTLLIRFSVKGDVLTVDKIGNRKDFYEN